MRADRAPVALAIGGALLLWSGAAAAGLPALVVHRTDAAIDCPDARALAELVAQQTKHPALEPRDRQPDGADRGLDVQIYRSEAGFTAVVQAGDKTRTLSDQGPTCGGLGAALAVSIAILLDTEPLPPAPEPPPAPPPTPEEAPPPAPLPEPPPPLRPSEPRAFRLVLAGGPLVTDGVLRPFAGGFSGELEVRVRWLSVSAGAMTLPGQSIDYKGGTVDLSLTAGLVRGCGTVLGDGDFRRLALCLEGLAGPLHGQGHGFPKDSTSTLTWGALGAGALFHQRIYGPFAFGARAELLVPLVKESFLVKNLGAAFATAPVGGALDAELRVTIW